MAYYSDIVVDDQTNAARAGVSITVLKADGALAALTDGFGAELMQPLLTNATGFFSFNATDAVYTLKYRYGGRLVREDEVIVGIPPEFVGPAGPLGNVINSLGTSTVAAPSQLAVSRITSGTAPWTLPDEANGDIIPSVGSKLPYLSGGVLKIA